MGFEKGNKYGQGRPLKSKNIVTNAVRELFERVITEDSEGIFEDLKELSAFQRLKIKVEIAMLFCFCEVLIFKATLWGKTTEGR